MQGLSHNAVQVPIQFAPDGRKAGLARFVFPESRHVGKVAGEQTVQDQAERIDISGGTDGLAPYLLRTGVCPRHRSRAGLGGFGKPFRIQDPGDAKIQQFGHAIGRHQDVAGFDVEMNHPLAMGVVHGGAHAPKQPQAIPHGKLSGLAPGVDSHARHMLEDQIREHVFGRAPIEKADHVGVLHTSQHLAFAQEAPQEMPRRRIAGSGP